MSRKSFSWIDCGIEEEIDPKVKFNSLLSVTVSTIMCLASKCPLPKSNVETTTLFLRTITDDNGDTPKNIRGLLALLDDYTGPFDVNSGDNSDELGVENSSGDTASGEKEKLLLECETESKNAIIQKLDKDNNHSSESQILIRKVTKTTTTKKNEKESKKKSKSLSVTSH